MIYYNEKDLFAYYATTLINSVYYGGRLVYGYPVDTSQAIVITPGNGLSFNQGGSFLAQGASTSEEVNYEITESFTIEDLLQDYTSSDGTIRYTKPSLSSTTYETTLVPTNTSMNSSESWVTNGIVNSLGLTEYNLIFYPDVYSCSWSQYSTSIYYQCGGTASWRTNSLSASTTHNNCIGCVGYWSHTLEVGKTYGISAQIEIPPVNGPSATWSSATVYIVDITNNKVLYSTTTTTSTVSSKTIYVSNAPYTAESTSTYFGLYIVWDSIAVGSTSGSYTPSLSTIGSKVSTRGSNTIYYYDTNYYVNPRYSSNILRLSTSRTSNAYSIARFQVNSSNQVSEIEILV